MGMSTHIIGFRPPDEQWRKMKAVWDSCVEANVPIPENVSEFFDYDDPDDNGVEVEIKTSEFSDDSSKGFEINVDDIPKNVTVIRFYNSW